ncbi:MAG: YtxH domain-containing protein [Vicinamibacterales bacterium]
MARDESSSAVVLMAFMLGAVAGAAVALLYAPQSGAETRRLLGEKAREGKDAASDAARQGREFVERQKDNVVQAVERGRETYERARAGLEERA